MRDITFSLRFSPNLEPGVVRGPSRASALQEGRLGASHFERGIAVVEGQAWGGSPRPGADAASAPIARCRASGRRENARRDGPRRAREQRHADLPVERRDDARGLAKELGPRKIRVNALKPGGVETEGTHRTGIMGSDFERAMVAQTPLGRIGQPNDIAPVVAFLASDDARWITGSLLDAAGGMR